MKKLEIYQITEDKEREFAFLGYDRVISKYGKVEKSNYKKVYECEIDVSNADEVFEKFNLNIPADFTGHSLSVSDVIVLDGNAYYCDRFGWQVVINF